MCGYSWVPSSATMEECRLASSESGHDFSPPKPISAKPLIDHISGNYQNLNWPGGRLQRRASFPVVSIACGDSEPTVIFPHHVSLNSYPPTPILASSTLTSILPSSTSLPSTSNP